MVLEEDFPNLTNSEVVLINSLYKALIHNVLTTNTPINYSL